MELLEKCLERIVIKTNNPDKATTVIEKMGIANYKVIDSDTIYVYESLSENASELIEGFMEGLEEGSTNETVQVGVGMNANTIVEAGTTLESWMESTNKIYMLLIIVALFVCNDFSGGYIKNTINIPKHKWYANISKMVVATVVFMIQNIIQC